MFITFPHNNEKARFEILTNESYGSVCQRLFQVDPELVQLEYRILSDSVYSEFSPLGTTELDWSYAMMRVCQAKEEFSEVEVDILEIRKPVSII